MIAQGVAAASGRRVSTQANEQKANESNLVSHLLRLIRRNRKPPLRRHTRHKLTLLSVNAWQLPSTKCQWAIVRSGESKKLVYDSEFRKLAEGMSFVNSKREPNSPSKYHADRRPRSSPESGTIPGRVQ